MHDGVNPLTWVTTGPICNVGWACSSREMRPSFCVSLLCPEWIINNKCALQQVCSQIQRIQMLLQYSITMNNLLVLLQLHVQAACSKMWHHETLTMLIMTMLILTIQHMQWCLWLQYMCKDLISTMLLAHCVQSTESPDNWVVLQE